MFNQIDTRSITFNLIVINVLMYILSNTVLPVMYDYLTLHYFGNPGLFDTKGFMPVQLLTHMFMHAPFHDPQGLGVYHILFNMYGLFMFGTILERVWGPKRFLFFYLFTGLGAAFVSMTVFGIIVYNGTGTLFPTAAQVMLSPSAAHAFMTVSYGASGALFGILIAFGVLFPNNELMIIPIPIPIKAKYLIALYLVYELLAGIYINDGIGHTAHLGGALFGFILVKIWNRNRTSLY